MAKPLPSPQTTPTRTITISFPNNGGNESTKSIPTEMSHPYRRSCSLVTKGVNQSMIYLS